MTPYSNYSKYESLLLYTLCWELLLNINLSKIRQNTSFIFSRILFKLFDLQNLAEQVRITTFSIMKTEANFKYKTIKCMYV